MTGERYPGVAWRVGQLLRDARRQRGWAQREAALRLGVSQSRVCAWERDRALPGVGQLPALASVYGLRLARLEAAHTADALDLARERITRRAGA